MRWLLRFDMRAPQTLMGSGLPGVASASDLYATALEMARYADANGASTITLSEHHGVDDGFLPSPISLMGAIAGCTEKVRIHVSALLVTLYDPVKLAEDLVVLDLLSQGRTGITAGMGYRPDEYAMFGVPWKGRGAYLDECMDVMLRAWRGERFEYKGRTVSVTPRPFTDPHPVVWMGGQSKVGARRAARLGLPYQPANNNAEMLELYTSECERLGVENPAVYPPGTGEMFWFSEDPDRAWSQIGPHLLHEAACYRSWQFEGQASSVKSEALTVDALREEGLYKILTPEEAIARGKADGKRAVFPLYPLCGGLPPDLAWESVRLFVEKVIPQL